MNQKVTTNQLTVMIAKGFNEVNQKIDQMQSDIIDIKSDVQDLQAAKANYVYKIDHNRLAHRVEVLEDKI